MNADWPVVLGNAFSVGFITGSEGIAVSVPGVLMTRVCDGHFIVEHYLGHHPPTQRGFFQTSSLRYTVYASL